MSKERVMWAACFAGLPPMAFLIRDPAWLQISLFTFQLSCAILFFTMFILLIREKI